MGQGQGMGMGMRMDQGQGMGMGVFPTGVGMNRKHTLTDHPAALSFDFQELLRG